MTRRELLASAGLAASSASRLLAARKMDRSRLSLLTDEIATSTADAIAFAKQYGIRNIELRGIPGGRGSYAFLPEAELKAAANEFKEHGLRITFLNTGMLKFTLPGTEPPRRRPEDDAARAKRLENEKAMFDRRLDDLRKAINAAHVFGVDKVRIFTFSRIAEPESLFPKIAEIIAEMAEIAAREKIYLLIENEGSCNVATSAESAAILKMLPSKWIGLNWDPLNAFGRETPFPDGYALLPKKRLMNVQIKGHSLLDEKRRLDWAGVFKATAKDGYKGYFGLETHYFDGTLLEKSHLSVKELFRIFETL